MKSLSVSTDWLESGQSVVREMADSLALVIPHAERGQPSGKRLDRLDRLRASVAGFVTGSHPEVLDLLVVRLVEAADHVLDHLGEVAGPQGGFFTVLGKSLDLGEKRLLVLFLTHQGHRRETTAPREHVDEVRFHG